MASLSSQALVAAGITGMIVGVLGTILFRRWMLRRSSTESQADGEHQLIEERFRTVYDHAPVMIDAFDDHGRCILWNRECERHLGWTADEIAAVEDPLTLFYPDPELQARVLETITRADGVFREYSVRAKDGSDHKQLWADFRLPSGTLISVGHDVTEPMHAQVALRESEEKYRAMFDNARDGIVMVDADGYILECNPEFEKQTGRTRSELRRLAVWDLRPGDQADAARQLFGRQSRDGHVGPVEQVFERPSGEVITIELQARRISLSGSLVNLGITRDISERKRIHEELKVNQERYRNLFKHSNDGILVQDLRGNIIDVNDRALSLFGYTKTEMLSLNVDQLHAPEVRDVARSALSQAIEKGYVSFEVDLKKKSGDKFPAEVSGSVFEAAGSRLVQGIIRDITYRRQAELALRESEEKYRQLFENAGVPITIYDREGTVLLINRIGAQNLGRSQADLIGTSLYDSFEEPEAGKFMRRFQYVLDTGELSYHEDRIDLPVGTRWFWSILLPVRDGAGRTHGVQVVSHDITEQKEAEEERELSKSQLQALYERLQRAREEESANIAREIHDELGQRLTVLKMDLSFIKRRLERKDKAVATDEALQRLAEMAADIDQTVQTVRRISTQLRPVVLDDLGLVGALEWQAEEFARRTGIQCQFEASAAADLDSDHSTAVFRIFQEILTNVARHADADRVNVQLYEDNGSLVMRVRDNGRGISEADISSPLALGLLGMRERAHLFGGKVDVDRLDERGTMVTVQIPCAMGT